MKTTTLLIGINFSLLTNSEAQFRIDGILKDCSKNENDSRERYIILKQNNSIIRKEVKTRLGEFSIKNLDPGNYVLEYINIFGQTCSNEITLKDKRVTTIELCTNQFIDTKKKTYFDLIQNDTLYLEYRSSGCFHSIQKTVIFYRDNENITAEIKDETGKKKKTIFTDDKKYSVSLFFRKMVEIKNGMQGCTTGESYILRMKDKKDIIFIDGTCDWNGFHEFEKLTN